MIVRPNVFPPTRFMNTDFFTDTVQEILNGTYNLRLHFGD